MEGFHGRTGDRYRTRGQSSVVGIVLIIGITIIGVTGVLLFGSTALLDAQTESEIDAAEHAMTQLDSRFSLVALGNSPYQSSVIDARSGTSVSVHEDRGWMNVTVINRTTDEVELTVFNTTLGAVVYENDGTTLAYQGGGVWKRAPSGGSVMVSPPEVHYRSSGGGDPTLTLPVIVVSGSGTLTGEARVSKAGTDAKFPEDGNADRTNPLDQGKINITVHSEFYRAWGWFFEQRTGGDVTYDADRRLAVIELVIEQESTPVSGGIVSGAAGDHLKIRNQATVDSYNSSDGDYSSNNGQNTSIVAAGDVSLDNSAEIQGDLVTGGTLTFTGNGQRVTGNVTYGTSPPAEPSKIDGWIKGGATVDAPDSVGWLIDRRGNALADGNNDNDLDGDISGTVLGNCDPSCTLTSGDYYLDEINIGQNEELILDTSGGPIDIYVDGDVRLEKDSSRISVTGGGRANLYVDDDLEVFKGDIDVTADRSPRLWIYMRPGAVAELKEARVVGVIYGPGSGAQSGVEIQFPGSGTEVFGGVVGKIAEGGSDKLAQQDTVHFDEALADEDPLGGYGDDTPTVTYMHATVNRVNVTTG